jgi:hypothetical protein
MFKEPNEVDREIKVFVDRKVKLMQIQLLQRVIMLPPPFKDNPDANTGFKHGQTVELMERFSEMWPELFDKTKATYDIETVKGYPPLITIDFGKVNHGARDSYDRVQVGGEGFTQQLNALLENLNETI